jgi:hypothetical protein
MFLVFWGLPSSLWLLLSIQDFTSFSNKYFLPCLECSRVFLTRALRVFVASGPGISSDSISALFP